MNIGIIGYGSMGKMLLGRFIDSVSDNLYVANRTQEKLSNINNSANVCHSNAELASCTDIIFLCVRPADLKAVLDEIHPVLKENSLIVSLNGSVTFDQLGKIMRHKMAKAIPSVTAEIGKSQTLVCFNDLVQTDDQKVLKQLLACIGDVIELPEKEMGMGSELVSCMPGFIASIFDVICQEAGKHTGLPERQIIRMVLNTMCATGEAFHRKENPRSGNVLMKSLMHPTDTAERFRRQGIHPGNDNCYCITSSEWKEMYSRTQVEYRWADGSDEDFHRFYLETEAYYSSIVGGLKNRQAFVPYNLSESVSDVVIASVNGTAVGCAGLKPYSDSDAEIKRVWVERNYRRNHIADEMMNRIERKAMELGFQRIILQTRPIMKDAVGLYLKRGYCQIENYPPYDQLDGAVCFAKVLG